MNPRILAFLAAISAAFPALAQQAPVADHHQHVFGPGVAGFFTQTGTREFKPVTAKDVIALLDTAGIRKAVILSSGYSFGSPRAKVDDEYDRVKAENDWVASQAAAYPGRLRAFCGFNPLKDYAVAEVRRCAAIPAASRGIKLHLGNADVQLDDPAQVEKVAQVFGAANAQKMAIVVHLRASLRNKRPYGAEQARTFLEKLLPHAPDVPVQIAHLAGTGPGFADPPAHAAIAFLADAVAKGDPRTKNLYFDVASIVDTNISPENAAFVAARIRQVGVDRVLYGTDAAIGDNLRPKESWAAFRRLPLTEDEFNRIAATVAPYLQ